MTPTPRTVMPKLILRTPLLLVLLLLITEIVQGVKIRNQKSPEGGFRRSAIQKVRTSFSQEHQAMAPPHERNLQAQCSVGTEQSLASSIVIDFFGEPSGLSTTETNLVASSILQSYNDVTLCGIGQFRAVTQVDLVTSLDDFANFGNATMIFSLEYRVSGTCQGCNATSPILIPDGGVDDSCPCGAPSIYFFKAVLEERLENFIDSREIQSINFFDLAAEIEVLPAAQCPSVSQFTTSDVVVEFFGCPLDLQTEKLTLLSSLFIATYNRINGDGTNVSAERCDPFFRKVSSAQAFLEDDFEIDFGRRGTGTTRSGRRRYLSKEMNDQEDELFGVQDIYDAERSLQGDSEFLCPNYFEIRFDVTVECRGCDIATATLFDEEEDGNFFESFDDDFDYFFDDDNVTSFDDDNVTSFDDDNVTSFDDDNVTSFDDDNVTSFEVDEPDEKSGELNGDGVDGDYFSIRRTLDENATFKTSGSTHRRMQSACRCPYDPFFGYRAVTEEEMINALNLTIEFGNDFPDLFDNDFPDLIVEDVIEIEEVECDAAVGSLKTLIDIAYATDSPDDILSDEIVNQLSAKLVRAYNDLAERFCDQQFRQVEAAEAIEQTVTPARRWRGRHLQIGTNQRPPFKFDFNESNIVDFKWSVNGNCRGCPSGSILTNDGARRLHEQEPQTPPKATSSSKYRRLQSGTQCYCAAVNVVEGAPTEREFAERYNADIQASTKILGHKYAIILFSEELQDNTPTEPPRIECTISSECVKQKAGTLCVNGECINLGNPRITLTWEGDDDLDLSVFTPSDNEIWYNSPFDQKTSGVFDTAYVQDVDAPHAESIYFPRSGAPGGTYGIAVYDYEIRNEADLWKIEVFLNNATEPVFVQTGTGFQDDMRYNFGDFISGGNEACSLEVPNTECCVDAHCTDDFEFDALCVNRQCITQGNPRFTLSYFGNDDYSLVVLTPDLNEIYFDLPFDNVTQGAFEKDKNEGLLKNAFHTENIFFPPGAPDGEYIFFVDSAQINGVAEEWTLEAAFDGEDPEIRTGSGFSNFFSFFVVECSINEDCLDGEVCVVDRCIVDGTPRFTLTWQGNDDLDIYVVTPAGDKIWWQNPLDESSSGTLDDDPNMWGFNHVESVFFEVSNAPEGVYTVGVKSYEQIDAADQWSMTINVDGESTQSWYNLVGEQEFTWTYSDPVKAPTPAPTPSFCFSGENLVRTEDRGEIPMSKLRLGDMIATSHTTFEPVYSFGHRSEFLDATYLSISPSNLEISADHMLFIYGGRTIPASLLQVGDQLANGDIITAIHQVIRTGVYAPFTPSGKLLLNGVLASNYVAFQGSEYLYVVGIDGITIQTPFTYQWLAHTFEAPHRLWCTCISRCTSEQYTDQGVSTWVHGPYQLAQWWLKFAMQPEESEHATSRVFTTACQILSVFTFLIILTALALLDTCMKYPYFFIGSAFLLTTTHLLLMRGSSRK